MSEFKITIDDEVVLTTSIRDEAIDFLMGYHGKDSNCRTHQELVLEKIESILRQYNVGELILARWGTFYKYECRGSRYCYTIVGESDINEDEPIYDTPEYDLIVKDIDAVIEQLLDEKTLDYEWGFDEQGGTEMRVRLSEGVYEIILDDYDPE